MRNSAKPINGQDDDRIIASPDHVTENEKSNNAAKPKDVTFHAHPLVTSDNISGRADAATSDTDRLLLLSQQDHASMTNSPLSERIQIRQSRSSHGARIINDGNASANASPGEPIPLASFSIQKNGLASTSSNDASDIRCNLQNLNSFDRRGSEVLQGNALKMLSIPDSRIQFQDPFDNRNGKSPAELRIHTDAFPKSRQVTRGKSNSLPSSPTGKKGRGIGRRGTAHVAMEPQTKRKSVPRLSQQQHKQDAGASSYMNRSAKLSVTSNDSTISNVGDLPLPPFSFPTYLDLELSSQRPPSHYIRPSSDYASFESSRVKLEMLVNFFVLPLKLELFIGFGTLVCLDSWLYTFTILPLRFCKAAWILILWLRKNLNKEIADMGASVYDTLVHFTKQFARKSGTTDIKEDKKHVFDAMNQRVASSGSMSKNVKLGSQNIASRRIKSRTGHSIFRHRRTRSTPSALVANHKADLLKGLLFIASCAFLTQLDASRMYHNIRGQATIKLYVIYNVLEVRFWIE